jgi:PAS domain S-box-containing protein
VEDATEDPRFGNNPYVTGEPCIRFYAGAAISVRGANVGALCVFDPHRRAFDPVLAQTLEMLAAVAAELCEAHAGHARLARQIEQTRLLNEELSASERRYASIFEHSSEGLAVVRVAEDGGFTYDDVNSTMQAITGLTPAQLVGRTPAEVFGADGGSKLIAKYRDALEAGRAISFVDRQALPGGERWFHSAMAPLPDAEGRNSRLLVSGRDITDLMEGQQALRESEARYQAVFEGVAEPLFVVNVGPAGFTYESGNRAFLQLWDHEEVAGRTPADLLPAEIAERVVAEYQRCVDLDGPADTEHPVPTPGGVRWFSTHHTPIRDHEGRITGLLGSSRDVTEQRMTARALRATEERFEVLFQHSADALSVFELNGRGEFVYDRLNKAAEAQLGRSQESVKGLRPEEVQSGDRVDARVDRYHQCVRDGAVIDYVDEIPSAGETRTFHALLVPLPGGKGSAGGVLASARDITERRNEEVRSREAHKLQAIGQLAGGIAHDFNNLLLIIDGFAQQALAGTSAAEPAEALGQVLTATERAKSLVQQLLVFSRRQISDRRAFIAASVVSETEALLRPLLGAQYDLRVTIHDVASYLHVETDSSELGQALMNLAINARDAMPGGGEIRIELDAATLGEGSRPS